MHSKLCSIIIPHYGDPYLTRELVEMLSQGTAGADALEVIVVDDGSPIPLQDVPGARVLRSEPNQGFGHAVNTGVRASSCDVVIVLNTDLSPGPHFVEDLVTAARPEFPALTSPMVTEHGVVVENRSAFPTVASMVASRSAIPALRNWTIPAGVQTRTRFGNREVAWVSGAALCFPRDVFETAGGFDEDFFMYLEDVDLQHRLRAAGVRRVLLENVSVEHLGAGSSTAAARRGWMVDSTFVYFRKRGRLAVLSAVWLGMISTNFAYDVMRRLKGKRVDVWGSAAQQWRLMKSGVAAGRRASRTHQG